MAKGGIALYKKGDSVEVMQNWNSAVVVGVVGVIVGNPVVKKGSNEFYYKVNLSANLAGQMNTALLPESVLSKISSVVKVKGNEKSFVYQKANNYKNSTYPISKINVDVKRFQNREKLNENIVNLIAENYDENQFDQLVLWKDSTGKVWLLAGHHRLKGAAKAGKKSVPYRFFEGSEAEAIKYAKELSNANRTLETPLERAKIYRDRLRKGESFKTIQKDAEKLEGKNARYILNLTALNPDGRIVNALVSLADNSDKATQQNLEKIADWTGEVRRQFGNLTNLHEEECYDFLMDNFSANSPTIKTKTTWVERIRAIVQSIDFEVNKPINLKRVKFKNAGETEYESQLSEIDAEIKKLEQKRDQLNDRFNNPRNPQYVNPNARDYDDLVKLADKQKDGIESQLKALRKKKLDLIQSKGNFQQAGLNQFDIFSMPQVQAIEKALPEKPYIEAIKKSLRETGAIETTALEYIVDLLQAAKAEKVILTDAQVIDIAKNIRSIIQSEPGIKADNKTTGKRRLAPSFNNLLRWSNDPGNYELVGVDVAGDVAPTVLARQVKKARIFNLLGIK